VAHGIAYALADPDPHARLRHLAATGHEHWSTVVVVAISLLVGGLALYLSGLVKDRGPATPPSFFGIGLRLVALQMTGFLALEVSERLWAGGISNLFSDPAVVLGLIVQVLIAGLAAALLALFTRGIVAILRRVRAARWGRTVSLARFFSSAQQPSLEVATGGGSVRGPPLPA
jgi:hypothetical protein